MTSPSEKINNILLDDITKNILEFVNYTNPPDSGPLFTKRTDVLLQDLVKSRSREIRV